MLFGLINWRVLLIIVIFASYSAFLYRIGSAPYRAELSAIKAAGKSQQESVGKINFATKELANETNKDAADAFKRIDDAYRLRKLPPRKLPDVATVAGGISAPPEASSAGAVAQQCNDRDSAHDSEQVILLQDFYNKQRAIINSLPGSAR